MQSLTSNRGGGQGLLAGIAVICILVAAYFIFKEAKSGKDDAFGNVYFYCTNCEKDFTGSSDEVPPVKCPHCQQITGVFARKYRCSECDTTFIGYLQKYDPQTQLAIQRRKKGEKVSDTEIKSIMVSEFGEELVGLRRDIADGLTEALDTPCIAADVGTEVAFTKPPSLRCAVCGRFSKKYQRKYARKRILYVCEKCYRLEDISDKLDVYLDGKRWELWDAQGT